jgi:hypothetical protein
VQRFVIMRTGYDVPAGLFFETPGETPNLTFRIAEVRIADSEENTGLRRGLASGAGFGLRQLRVSTMNTALPS